MADFFGKCLILDDLGVPLFEETNVEYIYIYIYLSPSSTQTYPPVLKHGVLERPFIADSGDFPS